MNLNWIKTAYPIKRSATVDWHRLAPQEKRRVEREFYEAWRNAVRRWGQPLSPGYIWKQVPLPPIIAGI